MAEISILAIGLAKGCFQVCGVKTDGAVVFNKSVSRPRLYQLLGEQGVVAQALPEAGSPLPPTDVMPWGRSPRCRER